MYTAIAAVLFNCLCHCSSVASVNSSLFIAGGFLHVSSMDMMRRTTVDYDNGEEEGLLSAFSDLFFYIISHPP